ncbi:MAG: glycoside hydrolase family 9 protein [Candidatus Sumerlaeota bacterium]|nr:glycoside hydrolase family 9 protein [Candidatus Sumerlaeota bacterium]
MRSEPSRDIKIKSWIAAGLVALFVAIGIAPAAELPKEAPRLPMKEEFVNSLRHEWLNKKVYEFQVLDDMEDISNWSFSGTGKMELTRDRAIEGSTSLRFHATLRDEKAIQQKGAIMGRAAITRKFSPPQDWSKFNRIAFWIYVHPSDIRVHAFFTGFRCLESSSSVADPEYYANVVAGLTPGQWNYVVWEIPNLKRDKVTGFWIVKLTTGRDAKESAEVIYDVDRLELQRVDADKCEGWEVAPGKFAYNHVGYKPDQSKVALASGLSASQFQLRDARSGNVVLTRPVQSAKNSRGGFQILDFSEIREPGEYVIWAGDRASKPFAIGDSLWLGTIRKALNFYYTQRCGFDVPGVHPECHKDMMGIHEGKKKPINGGWHDAGDLSQGSFRTSLSAYAMLLVMRQLEKGPLDPELQERLLDEAEWGLQWLLKTRFGGGYRITWNPLGFYTDGISGNADDVVRKADNIPWENFIAAGAEAMAAVALNERKQNPELAKQCLQAAEEDWQAAVAQQPQWLEGKVALNDAGVNRTVDNRAPFYHRWFSGGTYLTLSWGIVSSLHLYKATGRNDYADRALEYGRRLTQCQQQEFLDGISLTGFFYTSPEKVSIVHHRHAAFEESPLLALMALCREFPGHKDWMAWYSAAVLHSEYFLKRGSQFSAPYHVLPSAVYRKADILNVPDPALRNAMLSQFQEGTRLTDEYHLRFFPIWTSRTHHGNTAAHLSLTMALTVASQIRSNPGLEDLAATQLQWVFGGNPFAQTLMYGEGYDYPPLYAYNPGDQVGALPVGIDCARDDKPFWPAANEATFKEVWVVPVYQFLWNASYLAMPAFVQGELKSAVTDAIEFYDQSTSSCRKVKADRSGKFQTQLPAGQYAIRLGAASWSLAVVSGGSYHLALNPEQSVDFAVSVQSHDSEKKRVRVQAVATGKGRHDFSIRVFNGMAAEIKKTVTLKSNQKSEITWEIAVTNPKAPWIAVVVPDDDLTWKQELTGTLD